VLLTSAQRDFESGGLGADSLHARLSFLPSHMNVKVDQLRVTARL
jgi:hypothetical protein